MNTKELAFQPLTWLKASVVALIAVVCFHAAYTPANSGPLAFAIVGYVICLVQLGRLRTTRQAFYVGLVTGFACVAPQLECFWRIFGAAAIPLWLLLAFWIALFAVLTHLAIVHLGLKRAAILVPFLWTGLEYFRSELYFLKFSWLNVGYAFAEFPLFPWNFVGTYGVGFTAAAIAAAILIIKREYLSRIRLSQIIAVVLLSAIVAALLLPMPSHLPKASLVIAGTQLEFPDTTEIVKALDKLVDKQSSIKLRGVRADTNINLVVLSEYTLDGEPPDVLKDWCRTNQKFLIVGGKDASPGTNFYNTAFVIGTNGDIIFKQVKRVPIQFFKDGLPAPKQELWDSPWGKIGICICYDLCYTRVTDELVRQGAQMIIAPTMDVADWGRHQHELHGRIAPIRAAEYGIPIFRLASSGISQGVNRLGHVQTSAPYPGEGEMIFFGAHLSTKGSLPFDRWFAPACVAVTAAFVLWLLVETLKRKRGLPLSSVVPPA